MSLKVGEFLNKPGLADNLIYRILVDWAWLYASVAMIALAYIGAPETIQQMIHESFPDELKRHVLLVSDLKKVQLWIFWGGVILGLLGTLGMKFQQAQLDYKNKILEEDNSRLLEYAENRELDTYSLLTAYLRNIFDDLRMTAGERISLYKLDLDNFLCVGRYSDNELYRERAVRLYPKKQGCIGRAWENGRHQISDSPLYLDDRDGWILYHSKVYGYSAEELSNIKMKSASLLGVRLRDSKAETVAVIIFESINKDGLKFGKIEKYFNQNSQNALVLVLEALKQHMPTLEGAKLEGF